VFETASAAGKRPGLRFPARQPRLQDAVAGKEPRPKPGERVFGMVTGIASTDVTVAAEIYRRAKDAGLGTEIALT